MVIFEDRNNKIKVTIDDDVLDALHQSALESYPNETGGFLVGSYISNNHAHVTCLVQPVKKTCRPCSFERSTEGMKTVWDNLFEQGLIYLGEWHTHPNGSRDYSITDLEAMRSIASSADVQIIKPLLIIIAINVDKQSGIKLFHLDNNQLIKLEQN